MDITESTAPDGTEYVTFTDNVCHRQCSEPDLTACRAPRAPAELTPHAARMIHTQKREAGGPGTVVAVLAYTLVPVVAFREAGGELTSALVSILLSHGFQLAMSPEYTDILDQATEVDDSCSLTVTEANLLTLTVVEGVRPAAGWVSIWMGGTGGSSAVGLLLGYAGRLFLWPP